MSICQRDRWLAMIARSDDQVVLAPLGEAARTDAQVDLICDTACCMPSPRSRPAAIAGFNLPSAALEQALTGTLARTAGVVSSALTRLGLVARPGRGAVRRRPAGRISDGGRHRDRPRHQTARAPRRDLGDRFRTRPHHDQLHDRARRDALDERVAHVRRGLRHDLTNLLTSAKAPV